MQIKTILRLIGLLLVIFSLSMLTPLIINVIFHEKFWFPFVAAFLCTYGTGIFLWMCFRHHQQELKIRDGFLIVVLFWFVLCFFASLPFLFAIVRVTAGQASFGKSFTAIFLSSAAGPAPKKTY